MSKGNTFENEFLLHLFNNADVANIGDATGLRGSSAAGNFYLALHTADPGEGGNQQTSETSYTSYARVAVPRTAGGFTVTGNAVVNAALVQFPQCTGGSATETHFSVGTSASGAGKILYKGSLTAALAVSAGIQPQFEASTLNITED